ncbi:hypothetical protein MMC11_008794 [Xylographa trunciseda]|nr:hypothetical protein [Xylographa trunciseda]
MVTQSLADFTIIGPRTSLYTPPCPISGELIIICTWLGAAHKHVSKYTHLHRRIAPGARILLIESNVPILVSSYARQRRCIQSAAFLVLDTLAECGYHTPIEHPTSSDDSSPPSPASEKAPQPPKILLHIFSNGGANTATQLLLALHARLRGPLPLAGLVCDSCPAKGTYWKSYNAMVLSLPKDPPTRFLGALAVHFLLVLLYAWIAAGNENPAALMRRTLLDAETVCTRVEGEVEKRGDGERQEGVRRGCYLYSDADAMVEWTDIRDHAAEARSLGWEVREVRFTNSPHCGHLAVHEERYVKAVEEVWGAEGRKSWSRREGARL